MTNNTQAELLKRLAEDFGMSITGAEGLSGGALDAWIEGAEDACMWVVQVWTPEENERSPSSWSPLIATDVSPPRVEGAGGLAGFEAGRPPTPTPFGAGEPLNA
jgi:hypothetical protein